MIPLRFVLLADGSSDRALLPILRWSTFELAPDVKFFGPEFVVRDFSRKLDDEIKQVIARHEPDVLFVHRDAERAPLEQRRAEIPNVSGRVVRVVPVRMTEAWLLASESAIRTAAHNPNGTCKLALPELSKLESLPDPKQTLHDLILEASELGAKRRARLKPRLGTCVQLVAEHHATFKPLRALAAFRAFEDDLGACLSA